ncbi:MAG: hypothetical protein ABJE95_04345 [Byssovorax sp.]
MNALTPARISTTLPPPRHGARWISPKLLVTLAIGALLAGCGSEVVDVPTDGASASSSSGAGSSSSSTGTGTLGTTWPKRVTLLSSFAADASDGVQLADGITVPGPGDLSLYTGKVLSISSATPDSVCNKGTFDALSDIPIELDTCAADFYKGWTNYAYLSAASVHTTEQSYAIGLGLLLRDKEHTAVYRARVVGDSFDAEGMSTATFDYEPVP